MPSAPPATHERLWAATTPPDDVRDFREPLTLADALRGVLVPAFALRRDERVPARALGLALVDGHLRLGGRAYALRRRAARQLAALAGGHVSPPQVADAVRRGLRALGERTVLVRLDGEDVRAVLTARFTALDDREVFMRIERAVAAMRWSRRLLVRFVGVSESITVLRATLATSRVEVRSGDVFERGVEIINGEVGVVALRFTPLTWRALCSNVLLARAPSLRVIHARSARPIERDLRKDLAHALHGARALIDAWRSSAHADAANAITLGAQARTLRGRLADERRAVGVLGGLDSTG